MPKDLTIPNIMKKHHYQIEGLLNRFKKENRGNEDSKMNFNKFKWELEKHFFIEERAIFTMIYSDDKESNEMKIELLQEHQVILKKMAKIESDLKNGIELHISELQELLKNHRMFEDDVFYPKLNEELEASQKKEILDRISNPV